MKIRNLFFILLLVFTVAATAEALYAKSENNSVEKTVGIGHFDAIEAECVNVVVNVAPSDGKCVVRTTPELIDHVRVKVEDHTLKLSLDNEYMKGKKKGRKVNPSVTVSANTLEEIEASLASGIVVNGNLVCIGKLELSAETAGSIVIESLEAPELEVETETAASVRINGGKVVAVDLNAETASSIDCSVMAASSGRAEAGTAASIKCKVRNLTKKASTAGSVKNI